jgi:ribosomal-protein-alanine N-acetyltransferase
MQTIEEAKNFIDKVNANIESGTSLYWAIADRKTNQLLGTVCIWNIVEADSKAELGYELMYDFWGKGYMQECISKVVDFTFDKMGLNVIEAVIVQGNERSIKLAERNGFIFSAQKEVCLIFTLRRQ